MSIMKVGCPFCKAVLKSSKPMTIGKQITCVKCQKQFAVSAEVQLSVTGESHAGTSILLAETHAGLAKSPMANTPPTPSAAKEVAGAPGKSPPKAAIKEKEAPKPRADLKIDDGNSVVTVRRQRRSWGGLVAGILLLLVLGGGGVFAFLTFPEYFGQVKPVPPVAKAAPSRKTAPLSAPPIVHHPVKFEKLEKHARPITKSQQEKIDEAIDKGVRFLRAQVAEAGNWEPESDKDHPVGYAALPALALLECRVPPSDPVIIKAAEYVRTHCDDLADTYDLGLAVLLLDHLGDPADEPLLQRLAMRLVAGQTPAGGWDYKCPVLSSSDSLQLLKFLQGNRPKIEFFTPIARQDAGKPSTGEGEFKTVLTRTNADTIGLPDSLRSLPIVSYYAKRTRDIDCLRPGDNSNTQFGLLGVWAARRHRVPTELSLEMAGWRFQETQNPSGGWGYAMRGPSKNTMTCVGLLGLAMSHGAAAEAYLDAASKGRALPKTPLDDPFLKHGMTALGEFVDGDDSRRGLAGRVDFYYLWTLERVGMLYQRQTFGQHDWYQWGVKVLLDSQAPNGKWEAHYNSVADTSFALLFLRRSDLVHELTNNLQFYVALPK